MAALNFKCIQLRFQTRKLGNSNGYTCSHLHIYVLGSSNPLELVGRLCDQTGSEKIQEDGLYNSNECITAPRQDINGIPTSTPKLLGSSIPTELVQLLCDKTGSGSKMAASKRQLHVQILTDKCLRNSTALSTFSGSSFPVPKISQKVSCTQQFCDS